MDPQGLARKAMILTLGCMLFFMPLSLTVVSATAPPTGPASMDGAPTPPADPTVTALQKAQLAQQVEILQHQNNWLWNSSPALLSTLAVVVAALFGVFRWLRERRDEQMRILEDRQDEREKRSEQNFQRVIEDLSNEDLPTKVGAAIRPSAEIRAK